MTVRGMVRISALGALLLVAIAVASAVARGQNLSVMIEPKRDTVLTPMGRTPLLFGFDSSVVTRANLPVTVPARSYCVAARQVRDPRVGDVVFVDRILADASALEPTCEAGIPMMVRPACELSPNEDRNRPSIVICDLPPKVFLLSRPTAGPKADQ